MQKMSFDKEIKMESSYKEIKGFKRYAYLPRLGKIRLGIKQVSKKTGNEYPTEVDYFVCPPEVQKIYGEKPKILDIMFPSEDPTVVIPFCYKSYGSNQKIKCRGDGESAIFFDLESKEMKERICPCEALEQKKCDKRGHLMVILPRISLAGVYQIDTGSGVNINRILDTMAYWQGMIGRCKCIPLILERIPEKISNPDGKMQTHYPFKFGSLLNTDSLNVAIENNRKILAIEYKVSPPKEDGQLDDTPIQIIEDEETISSEKTPDLELRKTFDKVYQNFINPKAKTPTIEEKEWLKSAYGAGLKDDEIIALMNGWQTEFEKRKNMTTEELQTYKTSDKFMPIWTLLPK
jgi:hypothetical protein